MKTTAPLILLALAASATSAQQPVDCPAFAPIPGGSSGRDAISRCRLANTPTLQSAIEAVPEPIHARSVRSELTVVVDRTGRVVEEFTRYWTVSGAAGPFHDQLRDEVLGWNFAPGLVEGEPRQYGFRLHVITEGRRDEIPSRIEWSYRRGGAESDTLHGRWVSTDPPEPLDATRRAAAMRSVVGELTRMTVLLGQPSDAYCLIYRGPEREAVAQAVFGELGRAGLVAWDRGDRAGCAEEFHSLRLRLGDFVLAGGERMVIEVAGDVLPAWPPGFDALPARAWTGECVVPRSRDTAAPTLCNIQPVSTDVPGLGYREPELLEARPDDHPADLAFAARVSSSDAFAIDTLLGMASRVPDLTQAARFVPSPLICAGSIPYVAEGSAGTAGAVIVWLRPDITGGGPAEIDLVDVTTPRQDRTDPRPCGEAGVSGRPWFLFAVGGVGAPLQDTVTFCAHRPLCEQRHQVHPVIHEPLPEPHLAFTTSDLSDRARGGAFFVVRLNVDRDAPGLVPVMVRRTELRKSAHGFRRTAPGQFDLGINFIGEQWADAEYLIYFVSVGAPGPA